MDDSFYIPVIYKGEEKSFKADLVVTGYTSKLKIDVNGTDIFFEPDEERNYRALTDTLAPGVAEHIDVALLKAIAEKIQSLIG